MNTDDTEPCCEQQVEVEISTDAPQCTWMHGGNVLLLLLVSLAAWGALYYYLPVLIKLFIYNVLHLPPIPDVSGKGGLLCPTCDVIPGDLPPGQRLTAAVSFFLYEVPKVLLLLALVVFAMGIIRSFFTPERTRKLLAGKRESAGYFPAALLGVATPFCSCSAVPLFIGFVTSGVPLGVTFSFLISAPMINEVALGLLFGLFGWRIALLYLATGLLIAVLAGWTIGRLRMERHVEEWVYEAQLGENVEAEERLDWVRRVKYGLQAVKDIVGKVWLFMVLGIAVGAGIHGYVPQDFLASIMGEKAWWSVPLAVLIGIPIYSNAAGVIPVVEALLGKGAALGTVLAFMMAVIALSLPEMIILRRVLKLRLIATFIGVVAIGILIVGYLFNIIL